MRELPRWLRSSAEKLTELKGMRVDLRRSLVQHRGLALSVALPGVALTAIYTFAMWPPTAASPHFIGILAAAMALLLVSAACAAAAAVTAHNMDPRVYIGADVERVLGIAPMGELPDFAEVPQEVAEVDVLRLANGIVESCKRGSLRRCIVTGTQSGAGVTTVAVRLRAMLETMGRHAMLVDATGVQQSEGGENDFALFAMAGMGGESGSHRDELILTDTSPLPGSADTEFLARFADCVVVVAESGVTTRAQLLRSATCLQQLNVSSVGFVVNRVRHTQPSHISRPMAPAAAVGEFAAAVKRALADAPKRVPTAPKPPFANMAVAETAAQEPSASKNPTASPLQKNLAMNPSAATDALAIVPKPPESTAWTTSGTLPGISEGNPEEIPDWLSEALAQLEAKDPDAKAAPAQTTEGPKTQAEEPTEPAAADTAALQAEVPEKEQVTFEAHLNENGLSEVDLEAMLEAMGLKNSHLWNDFVSPSGVVPPPAPEERSENMPSRLSGLRNLTFPADLKSLHTEQFNGTNGAAAATTEEHRSEQQDSHSSVANGDASRLEGLRRLVNPESLKDLSHAREPFSAPGAGYGDPFHDSAKPLKGAVQETNGPGQMNGLAQPTNGRGPRMTDPMPPAEVQTFIPFPDMAAIEEELRGDADSGSENGNGYSNVSKFPKSQQDRRPTEDPVQILPSRQGQYRKRK